MLAPTYREPITSGFLDAKVPVAVYQYGRRSILVDLGPLVPSGWDLKVHSPGRSRQVLSNLGVLTWAQVDRHRIWPSSDQICQFIQYQ